MGGKGKGKGKGSDRQDMVCPTKAHTLEVDASPILERVCSPPL